VLDHKGVGRAVICGISFGGMIAVRFAATHPTRTAALILVSTPPSGMGLKRRHQFYLRMPSVLGPLLLAEAPFRLGPEVRRALPDSAARRRFFYTALKTLVCAPASPARMAARTRLLTSVDLRQDCERIAAPTLVVSGEPGHDFVVPVEGASQYVRLIPHARRAVIERSGHLGTVTLPEVFAAIVRDFVASDAGIRWPDAAA
jgi:pimeloyl-ACP methyl ester carboxylesterase